jgi:hypothetical protein
MLCLRAHHHHLMILTMVLTIGLHMKIGHNLNSLIIYSLRIKLLPVGLTTIEGHVPWEMVRTLHAFLKFCYIAHHDVINTKLLVELEQALEKFHHYCTIFVETGIHAGFNVPQQHFLCHYPVLIRAYGAPSGLCSSITESKHIKAVKQPWWHSSHYKAPGQMLLMNQQLDKLATSHVDFTHHGMLIGTCLSYTLFTFDSKFWPSCVFLSTHHTISTGASHITQNDEDHVNIGNNIKHNNIDADSNDDEGSKAPGLTVLASVELAKTVGKSLFTYPNKTCINTHFLSTT